MKLLVLYCGGRIPIRRDSFSVTFDDTFALRFLRHMSNDPDYCKGCGALCDHCRDTYGIDFSGDIVDIIQLPSTLPYYVDDPLDIVGRQLPPHEATVAINVHQEILLALPDLASAAGSRVLIVPSEAPSWTSRWLKGQVKASCRKLGIGCAFPKPFCSLAPGLHPAVDEFMDCFHIGKPEIELQLGDGYIREARVVRSAPCGNTYYVAFNLKGAPLDTRVAETVAKYWHSFPCVASMEIDRELGETILHMGGFMHYLAVQEALARVGIEVKLPNSPVVGRLLAG
jgi:thymidylate synthase